MLRWTRIWIAVAPAALLAVAALSWTSSAQSSWPLPEELTWIGLFNGEMIHWLDNGGRLDELCPDGRHTPSWHECRQQKLQPKLLVVPLYAEPRADAAGRGEIVIVARPGNGLQAFASGYRRVEAFTPDMHDPDYGYGPPYYHQTVLENRGNWYRIPVPSLGVAWMDAGDLQPSPAQEVTLALDDGQIIVFGEQSLLVLGVKNRVLVARLEQERDMWCRSEPEPPLAPWEEIRIPFEDLFDAEGHLRIAIKYTRGC